MSPHESEKYSPVAVGSGICAKPVRFVTSSWNLGKSICFSGFVGAGRRCAGRDVELANGVAAGDRAALFRFGRQHYIHERVDNRANLRVRACRLLERTIVLADDESVFFGFAIRYDALLAQDLRHFI